MAKEVVLAYLDGELLEKTPIHKLEEEAIREDDLAALNLAASVISNADMIEDPRIWVKFLD